MFTAIMCAAALVAAIFFGGRYLVERSQMARAERLSRELKAKREGRVLSIHPARENTLSFAIELPGADERRVARTSAIMRVNEFGGQLRLAYNGESTLHHMTEARARSIRTKMNAIIKDHGLKPSDCGLKSWGAINRFVEGITNAEAARIGDKLKRPAERTRGNDDTFSTSVLDDDSLVLVGEEARRLQMLDNRNKPRRDTAKRRTRPATDSVAPPAN